MRRVPVLVLLCLLLRPASAPAEWTSWRGPEQDGSSAETGLVTSWSRAGEHLIWRDDFVGRSTPVLVDERVCAFGRTGTERDRGERLACWRAADGEKLWELPLVVHNTTIPFTRAAWSSPVADPETGYVYTQGSDGHLTAFDRDGGIVWQRALHEEQGRFSGYGGRTANPVLFEDLLIANVINSSVLGHGKPAHRYYGFDKRSGEIRWVSSSSEAPKDLNTYSTPVIATIDGREQMIGGGADGWIHALEPRTGRAIWRFHLSQVGINTSPVVAGDTVFASHSQDNVDRGTMGRLVAIDAAGRGDVTASGLRWDIDELRAGYASPAYENGVLYVVDDSANLHGIDAATGERLWDPVKIGTVGKGSPVWADGHLYATEVNGRLSILAVDREGARIVDQDEISMPSGRYAELYGSVAISDGRIYLTTEEGIYCLGDPAREPSPDEADARATPVPAGEGDAATLALIPAEVLIEPGDAVRFHARAFDAAGRPLGEVAPVALALDGLAGEIDTGAARFVAATDAPFQVGHVVASRGDLEARARVRVIAPPPWTEGFSGRPVGAPLPHWIYGGRFHVVQRDREPMLEKFPTPAGLERTRTYLSPASWSDYTIQADLMSLREGSTQGDIGLVNSGYTLELLGVHQQLLVSSWHAELRMAERVDFPWRPDTFYRMVLRVEPLGERRTRVLGKVWPRDEPEPTAWTLEVVDDFGVTEGAAGLYGYSPVSIFYDEVSVLPNAPLPASVAVAPAATTAATAPSPAPVAAPTPRTAPPAPAPEGPAALFGGSPSRNMVSDETGLPDDWDMESGANILWTAKLGSQSYAGPVLFDGTVYVGTNNESPRDPSVVGDHGVVMAFDAESGELRWQIAHPKLPRGRVNDWPLQGVCSTPFVQGERLWYVSNQARVVCADTRGFHDGENDGPFTDESDTSEHAGDIVWSFDMMEELDVFPHNLAASSPLAKGGLLFVVTGNGVDEGHVNIPSPRAPSFIALDQATGELVWADASPGNHILHGSWSNPAYGEVDGVAQVIFPGGDGWVYAFVPETGELLWKFDLNPKDSVWELGGAGTRNNVISTPVVHDGRVYVAVGQDPEHGEGVGHLYAIDASGRGDITERGRVWHRGGEDFRRSISTVAIADGLLYAVDLSGFLHALDVETGAPHWIYDAFAAVWSSPFVADGKVYLTDEDGDVAILEHGPEMRLLREISMDDSIYTTPIAHDGKLFLSSRSHLFAIGAR